MLHKQDMNPIKKDLKELTVRRVKQYREQKDKVDVFLSANPEIPYQQKERDRQLVLHNVAFLDTFYQEIIPYVRKIRTQIEDITDQNKITATYLLFGKSIQGLGAIFLLAENGFHYEVMEIVRSTQESLDLAFYFMENEDTNPNLLKWFEGDIISNSETRKQVQQFSNENEKDKLGEVLPFEKVKAGIYSGLSSYTHVSYASLLDSFDVYNKDFDFVKIAGYHYVQSTSLSYAKILIESIIIELKHFYSNIKDITTYKELSSLLERFNPDINDKEKIDQLQKNILNKFESN